MAEFRAAWRRLNSDFKAELCHCNQVAGCGFGWQLPAGQAGLKGQSGCGQGLG